MPANDVPEVLLIEGSTDVARRLARPIEAAGCLCVPVADVGEALAALSHLTPAMTFVAATAQHGGDALLAARLGSHPAHQRAPLVLTADSTVHSEWIETWGLAGADDFILGPLSVTSVVSRLQAMQRPERVHRRVRHLVLVGRRTLRARALGTALEESGLRLCYLDELAQVAPHLAQLAAPPDAVVVQCEDGVLPASLAAIAPRPGEPLPRCFVLSAAPAPAPLPAPVTQWLSSRAPLAVLVDTISAAIGCSRSTLSADSRVPFFCPVEFREAEQPAAPWTSGFSWALSPLGIFVRTLVPERIGAPVELRIHLTTTGEMLDGTGVVSWANAFHPLAPFASPLGMGIQFLGPAMLRRLKSLCKAVAAAA